MKMKSILLSLGLIAAPFTVSAQQAENTFKANPKLSTALKHVDTDGEALNLSNQQDFLEDISNYYDRLLGPFLEMNEGTQSLKFIQCIKLLGLSNISATASSCKKYESHYINKFFIQTSEQNTGLWSLLGKANQAPVASKFAPANTNLLLESQVNTKELYTMLIGMLRMINPDVAALTVDNMQQAIPPTDMTVKELLAKIDSRVSIVGNVNLSEAIKDISKSPTFVFTARADRVAKLLFPIIEPDLTDMGLGEFESKGNQHSFSFPEIPSDFGPIVLTLHFDLDKDFIWVTTDKKHLAICRDTKTPKLASHPDYKNAIKNLPQTHCAQLYISQDLVADFFRAGDKSFETSEQEPMLTIRKTLRNLVPMMANSQGITWVLQKNQDGILINSNTPFRIRGAMVQYMTLISVVSSVATPLILQKRKDADRTRNVGHMTQLKLALVVYEDEHGKRPDTLDDLVKGGAIGKDALNTIKTMRTDRGKMPVTYIYRKAPKGNDVIMHTPAPIDGKHVILKSNGAVLTIPAGKLELLLK